MANFEAACRVQDDGVVLKLRVHPGASRNAFGELYGDAIKLSLQAPPVDGKANTALIKYLANICDVPRGSVELLTGQTSREKRILIHGKTIPEILTILDKQ